MKIDTSGIENFDNLSAEEKLDAIMNLDVKDANEVEKHYKDLISKANSEAKKYKEEAKKAADKLKETLPEDERKTKEREERYKAIEEENERLKREALIAQKERFYSSLGFTQELARETAEAFANGDFATVEKNHLTAHAEFEKDLRADVVRQNPHPQNQSGGGTQLTKSEIMKVKDATKRQQLIAENIELFV